MKQSDQNTKPAYVYLMACEGFVKVGVAVDPSWRLTTIQVGNPFEVTLFASRLFRTFAEATRCEWTLHKDFAEQMHRGEWFRVEPETAKSALDAYRVYGEPKHRKRGDPLPVTAMPFKGQPERAATAEEVARVRGWQVQ